MGIDYETNKKDPEGSGVQRGAGAFYFEVL